MTRQNLGSVLKSSLPFWGDLSREEQEDVAVNSILQEYKTGALIHNSTVGANSPGVQIVKHGRVRAFISSPEGKQLTLQRMGDNQLFAIGLSCVFDDAIFDVSLETEMQSEMVLIPRSVCKRLFDANYKAKTSMTKIITSRFATTMRILEAVTFASTKSRLANALIEQSSLAGSFVFKATHARMAADIGSTREVVTRLLNQFQIDGFLTLLRGQIQIDDRQALVDMRGGYLDYISNPLCPQK